VLAPQAFPVRATPLIGNIMQRRRTDLTVRASAKAADAGQKGKCGKTPFERSDLFLPPPRSPPPPPLPPPPLTPAFLHPPTPHADYILSGPLIGSAAGLDAASVSADISDWVAVGQQLMQQLGFSADKLTGEDGGGRLSLISHTLRVLVCASFVFLSFFFIYCDLQQCPVLSPLYPRF
jgi:hypothetical protein